VAAFRWAGAVARVVAAPHDVPTVGVWAPLAGMSRRTLYRLCEVVGTSAKPSLNLGRLARTLQAADPADWRPEFSLNADLRTVQSLLDEAGVRHHHGQPAPTLADLFASPAWALPVSLRAALVAVLYASPRGR